MLGIEAQAAEGPSDIVYLQVLSQALTKRGREGLDPKWTLCPSDGIDKIAPFVRLFDGNRINMAAFSDIANGDKTKFLAASPAGEYSICANSPDAQNTVVYGNEGVAAPTLASLLISPGQTETSSYLAKTGSETTGSFRLNLRAVGMLNTRLAQNQDPATITWTLTADCDLPRALRVDNGVLVIPEPSNVSSGSRRTLVQITGTKGAATGKAYLVLN